MPKDIIDVIDTAVKIGFGALISGVTTYFVANKNHNNDKSKSLIENKVKILEHSIENIEPYFYAIDSYFSRIDGILKTTPEKAGNSIETNLLNSIKTRDSQLIDARKEKSIALSRLKLIGASEVTKHLSGISGVENNFRLLIIFEKKLPTIEQLIEFRKQYKTEKNKFYKSIESKFESIYS